MDRRSFILVSLFALTLFLVNHFFFPPDLEKHQVYEKSKVEKVKHIKSVSASALPLVKFYTDSSEKELIGYGISSGNSFILSPSDTKNVPETLFVSSSHGSSHVKKTVNLSSKMSLGIFTINGESPSIDSFFMPEASQQEVQLVSGSNELKITPGFYENGFIQLMQGADDEDALVLSKYSSEFLPVGFYNSKNGTFIPFNHVPKLAKVVDYKPLKSTDSTQADENFYVLENDYQQVVFSNIGGSIAELNLPFKSDTNKKSVVLPIKMDKTLLKDSPQNAFFPLQPYKSYNSSSLLKPKLGGYYPLIRRDLEKASGRPAFITPARYYALNVVSDDEQNLAKARYKVKRFEKNLIEFELSQPHRRIKKTYYFEKSNQGDIPYTLKVDLKVDGDAAGLFVTSGIPEIELVSGSSAPSVKYRYTKNKKNLVEQFKLPKDASTLKGIYPDWVSNANGFFGLIIDPTSEVSPGINVEHIPGTNAPSRISLVDSKYDRYATSKYPGYLVRLPVKNTSNLATYTLFAGPYDGEILNVVDKALANSQTGYNPKFSEAQTFHGWFAFISEPFAKFLLFLMKFFHSFTHSWALSIFLITLVLTILLYPLNSWSTKSMTKMQLLAPEISKIDKKFAKDPKRAQMEKMMLYKERKVSPFSAFLPLIIKMPFLLGMLDLLKSAFQLRGAVFIPGWINDLAAPDVLFSWSYPIFFFGTEFHLLPFILGGLMFLQSKITTWLNPKAKPDKVNQSQTAMTGNIMTIAFTLLFYNLPSGLSIYWISSTILGLVQQLLTTKQLQKQGELTQA